MHVAPSAAERMQPGDDDHTAACMPHATLENKYAAGLTAVFVSCSAACSLCLTLLSAPPLRPATLGEH
jgi:hypothetical protein